MRAIIFDLDGTLLNTLADIASAANAVLKKHDYATHPVEEYKLMVGNGFDKLMERALPQMPGNLPSLVKEAKEHYAGHMMDATRPYTGMPETLQALAQEGFLLNVVSNKPDRLSAELIAHYFPSIPFKFVYGARDGVPLKPDPAIVNEVLAMLGVNANEACYCGDSDVDMLTAKNAGLAAIGAAWGFRGAAELEKAGADYILNSPMDILSIFK